MRGAVSLAAALALPLTTDAGTPFPNRELIVFLTFSVILVTVVVQGLTLPKLIDVLELEDDRGLEAKEDTKARIHAADAALARLEELVDEEWVREDTADRLRGLYGYRRSRFKARFDGRRRGAHRAALDRLPAPASRADRGRARGGSSPPARAKDQRRGHAAGRT